MKLYAVRIFVSQWQEACDFYGKTLGLPERFRNDDIGWAEYDLDGPCLGIERVAADDHESLAYVGRFVGVSLLVDDLQSTYRELLAQGVTFTGPPEQQAWGGVLAFCEDPDGNQLTLLEAG